MTTIRIPQSLIPGLKKPLSRLLLGNDHKQEPDAGFALWDHFYAQGGNGFDTAYNYDMGAPECLLGEWMEKRALREKIVVLDKGGRKPPYHPDGVPDPETITSQLLESLQRLRTDYVDIYMLHRDNPKLPVGAMVDVLNEHYRAKRIRVIGVSNWKDERIREANEYARRKGLQGFTAISNQFSLARMVTPIWVGCESSSSPESRRWLAQTQLTLIPWSSQARAFFLRANRNDTSDAWMVKGFYCDDNFQRFERVQKMAKEKGISPLNLSLAYVLNQPFPTFPLIGPLTPQEIDGCLPALEIKLTPAEIAWLNLETA